MDLSLNDNFIFREIIKPCAFSFCSRHGMSGFDGSRMAVLG